MNETTSSTPQIDRRKAQTRQWLAAPFVLALGFAAVNSASAQVHPCGDNIDTVRVAYAAQFTNKLDSRTDPGDPDHKVLLVGSLHYKTPSTGTILKNRPVLIFNHGHERQRNEACEIVQFFTEKNWVVFVPLRRGYYLDVNENDVLDWADPRSTGIYIDDFVEACSRTKAQAASDSNLSHLYCGSGFCRAGLACDADNFRSAIEMDYLRQQRFDVRDQIAFVKSISAIGAAEFTKHDWKLADPGRIVILGHSYGGGLMVFTNTEDYGQSAAIDIQGAELSWDNKDDAYWAIDLKSAMSSQERPIYFLQPKNGLSLLPTKTLFGLGVLRQYRSQAAIFGNAPCKGYDTDKEGNRIEVFSLPGKPCPGPTPEPRQFHASFISHAEQVAKWGSSVIEFANRNQR